MLKIFDYIFYRIYFFYKSQSFDIMEIYASALVSLAQSFTLLTIFSIISLGVDITAFSKFYGLLVIIPLLIFNWHRYERNFDIEEFVMQWAGETSSEKKMKGWLIVVYFAIIVLTPVMIGVLRYNFGLI